MGTVPGCVCGLASLLLRQSFIRPWERSQGSGAFSRASGMQGGVSDRRSTLEFCICYRSSWSEWFHPDDSVREQGAAVVRAGVGAAAGAGLR